MTGTMWGNLKCRSPPTDITAVANVLSVGRPTLKCFLGKRKERKMGKETRLKNEKMSEWEVGMWRGAAREDLGTSGVLVISGTVLKH